MSNFLHDRFFVPNGCCYACIKCPEESRGRLDNKLTGKIIFRYKLRHRCKEFLAISQLAPASKSAYDGNIPTLNMTCFVIPKK